MADARTCEEAAIMASLDTGSWNDVW